MMRQSPKGEQAVIKVSVLYPNQDGVTFDHDYYRDKHMALVREKMGNGLKRIEIDRGMAGGGDAPAPFVAIGHLFFNNMEDLQLAMAQAGSAPMEDIPNFTNAQPQILIAETAEA